MGQDLRWVKRTAGVSGGCVLAVAVACGYTVDELKEIALSFDFTGIAEETERATAILQTPSTISRLLSDFGAVSGEILAHRVDEIIQKQTGLCGATFQQLYDHTGVLLKIFATSLRCGELVEFSAMQTPNDQVCVAARASMAVPFLFDAVWTKEGDRLVDGAMIDNCPVWCFDEGASPSPSTGSKTRGRGSGGGAGMGGGWGGGGVSGAHEGGHGSPQLNPRTLALWINTGRDPQQATPRSLQGFCVRVGDLVQHMLQQQRQETYMDDVRIVWVQTPEIPISTFRLDHVLQAKLYAAGSRSAREYLARMSGTPTAQGAGAGVGAAGGGKGEGEGGAGTRLMAGGAGLRPDPQHILLIKRFVRFWSIERRRSASLLPRLGKHKEPSLASTDAVLNP
jgi:predicted acylesterase/phospholipase RssA